MDYLLDTNILVRIVQPAAPEYTTVIAAVTALLEQGHRLYVGGQILIEFWSVATRPAKANGLGMTPDEARLELEQIENSFRSYPINSRYIYTGGTSSSRTASPERKSTTRASLPSC